MDRFSLRLASLGLMFLPLLACGSSVSLTPDQADQVLEVVHSEVTGVRDSALALSRGGSQQITVNGTLTRPTAVRGTVSADGGQATVATMESETDYSYYVDFDGWRSSSGLRLTGWAKLLHYPEGAGVLTEVLLGEVTVVPSSDGSRSPPIGAIDGVVELSLKSTFDARCARTRGTVGKVPILQEVCTPL